MHGQAGGRGSLHPRRQSFSTWDFSSAFLTFFSAKSSPGPLRPADGGRRKGRDGRRGREGEKESTLPTPSYSSFDDLVVVAVVVVLLLLLTVLARAPRSIGIWVRDSIRPEPMAIWQM